MNKKIISALLCLCLLLPAAALATEGQPVSNGQIAGKWAKGTVNTSKTVDVYAPVGGQLQAFDLELGDDITQGEDLMRVRPADVLAPYAGLVRLQHAQIGDLAQNVVGTYGALCYIERQDVAWLRTNTQTAYDDNENRDIRAGETLRVYNNKSGDSKETTGRVVSVTGTDFVVEFPSGVFDIGTDIRVYRGTGDTYKDKDMVGKGKAERPPLIHLSAEGTIADILVEEGDTVARNQSVYVMDSATARYDEAANPHVAAQSDGVLTALYVQAGQQVAKDQLLLTITPLDALECVVEVDELDVLSLSVGQTLQVKVDAKSGEMLSATVTRIAPLGKVVLDTTKYDVTLTFPTNPGGLLPGMHVTAYWD